MGHCFCLSGKSYDHCCGPFIVGKTNPPTPEQLMRSRYSGFCLKDADYLLRTLHPDSPQTTDREALQETFQNTQWLGLKIVQAPPVSDDLGTVEFVAFFKTSTQDIGQLHERSEFRQDNHQWYYVDGEQLPPIKLYSNAHCICGSGKKLKRCCQNVCRIQ